MTEITDAGRREFLRRSLGLGLALGFGGLGKLEEAFGAEAADAELWRGGTRLGELAFQAEPDDPVGTPIAGGLDARLYTDLSKLDPDRLITPVEEFFVRTETPDRLNVSQLSAETWRIRIGGLVERPRDLSAAELAPPAGAMGVHHIECAGNTRWTRFGLMSAAEWWGVGLSQVLSSVGIQPRATSVLIGGFDDHSRPSTNSSAGCSWIFTREQLESAGAFLATRMNGRELTPDHGFPVRLVVPGWYGCCWVKWVDRIELVDDGRPATAHMKEFALRTHQGGEPEMAAQYRPATVDRAAMPVRIEKWRVRDAAGDAVRYRVVGIDWGGDRSKGRLMIRFRPDAPYEPVRFPPAAASSSTWALWHHPWSPAAPGRFLIQLDVDDPSLRAVRLRSGFYLRGVEIDEV